MGTAPSPPDWSTQAPTSMSCTMRKKSLQSTPRQRRQGQCRASPTYRASRTCRASSTRWHCSAAAAVVPSLRGRCDWRTSGPFCHPRLPHPDPHPCPAAARPPPCGLQDWHTSRPFCPPCPGRSHRYRNLTKKLEKSKKIDRRMTIKDSPYFKCHKCHNLGWIKCITQKTLSGCKRSYRSLYQLGTFERL